ncbi:hypothetical protein ACOSP6_00415 [Tenacibaculum sp. MEBiC06402]|uniref:FEKKY domain-containing protein n=1 Tax=unclassified Tenacibaculum TaxID=2635139 RepID=UPI003B996C28
MKRKKKIIIGIGILVFGISLWSFGIVNKYNFLTAKLDIMNHNPKIVTVGFPIFSHTELNMISEKYGFKNVNFGCIVTQSELNGIDFYNAVMEEYLEKKNGINWRKKYNKEIDSLIKIKRLN